MKEPKAPEVTSDINVTPMVDVMLVLLIIFMVITPMLTKGAAVDMVKAKNPIAMKDADKEDAILVAVTRNGQVFLSPGNKQITAGGSARQGPRSADQQAGQDGLHQGGHARQVRERWKTWWTTCARRAWISWDC